jgi:hypothetical protein
MLAFCPRFSILLVLAATVVLAAGCSSGTQPSLDPGNAFDSTATLVIGDVTYALKVACYELGPDLTVVGTGTDKATGKAVKGLIHGPERACVGLVFGSDEYIYEADAHVPLTIERDGGRLTGDAISFVRNVDLASAQGEAVGTGSVTVECSSTSAGAAPTI